MSNIVTKNNLKVKLADGLTPFGMSQVKKEIGGAGDTTPILVVKPDNDGYYLVNPTTKLPYALSEITSENIQTLFDQIEQDYPFLKFENVESTDICKIIGSFKVDLIVFYDETSGFPIEFESWTTTCGNFYRLDETWGEEVEGEMPLLNIIFENIADAGTDFHLEPNFE